MRKYLLSLLSLTPLALYSWNVGTDPQPSNALIEEYTGIHCPNCPDGHAVAARLCGLHPEEVYSVAIHAGYYATPKGKEPDFITPLGETLLDHFKVGFFPAGMINRSSGVTSRSSWGSECRDAVGKISPVNLWTGLSYDPSSRTVTLDVEGYYTSSMSDPRLNVFLLQSEILGPQDGGQLGTEYPHRHMLRGRISGDDFGDPITEKNEGEYFYKTYTYVIPEEIGGVGADPANMALLTFVTEGADEIAQVTEDRISHPDLPAIFSISATAPSIPIGRNYAFDYLEIMVYNHGNVPLESAEFEVTLNGDLQNIIWSGNLPPHSAETIRLPLAGSWDSALDAESNSYIVRLIKGNGNDVESFSLRGSFNEIGSFPAELTLKIKTDIDTADNMWRILDRNGETVAEFGPYPDGLAEEYIETVTLDPDKVYCLEVRDAWGDGICHPAGYVKLFNKDGEQVGQYREIRDFGMRQFFRATDNSGVVSVAGNEIVNVEYFDMSGRRIANPDGLAVKRTVYAAGNVTVRKVMK